MACQVVRAPAFPPPIVLEIVKVVHARGEGHLPAQTVKPLEENDKQDDTESGGQSVSQTATHTHTHTSSNIHLIEAAGRHAWVTVMLGADV